MRRDLFFVIFTLYFVAAKAFASDKTTPVKVKDVNGDIFSVAPADLFSAYEGWFRISNSSFGHIFVNSDESVTLTEPRFFYKGVRLAFGVPSPPLRESKLYERMLGICKLYGFKNFVLYESIDDPYCNTIVYLDKDSNLVMVGPISFDSKLESITCRH